MQYNIYRNQAHSYHRKILSALFSVVAVILQPDLLQRKQTCVIYIIFSHKRTTSKDNRWRSPFAFAFCNCFDLFELHDLVFLAGLLLHKHILIALVHPFALHTINLASHVDAVCAGLFAFQIQNLLSEMSFRTIAIIPRSENN